MVGHDEDRYVEGWVVSPWRHTVVEDAPSHYRGPNVGVRCAKHVGVGAGEVWALAPVPQALQPRMQPVATLPQRLLRSVVGPGGEPVQ